MGEPSLRPAHVRLRSATGDDMEVIGRIFVCGWCDGKLVELSGLVATRATRSLCTASKLLSDGYEVQMKPIFSVLHRRNDESVLLRGSGTRDFLVIRLAKTSDINAITTSTMKREVKSLKSELRALRTGHLSTTEVRRPRTREEKHRHEVDGHAEYDNRCENCVKSIWCFTTSSAGVV